MEETDEEIRKLRLEAAQIDLDAARLRRSAAETDVNAAHARLREARRNQPPLWTHPGAGEQRVSEARAVEREVVRGTLRHALPITPAMEAQGAFYRRLLGPDDRSPSTPEVSSEEP